MMNITLLASHGINYTSAGWLVALNFSFFGFYIGASDFNNLPRVGLVGMFLIYFP
jgi:hypothetical protein